MVSSPTSILSAKVNELFCLPSLTLTPFALHLLLNSTTILPESFLPAALQKLPEVPKAFLQADAASRETSGRVIVLTIGDEVMIGSLLAEQDVLAHVAAKASAPASTDDRCEAVDDAVRKLRTCLSGMSLSMQWKHVSLFQLLETKLAKATLLQDRDQISKLSEVSLRAGQPLVSRLLFPAPQSFPSLHSQTLRCLHNLPAKYLADGASHLLSALEADFTQRSAYIRSA